MLIAFRARFEACPMRYFPDQEMAGTGMVAWYRFSAPTAKKGVGRGGARIRG